MRLAGGAGLAVVSALREETGLASAARQQTAARPRAPTYSAIPSWKTELRQLAPNVYVYTQAGGPGLDNASLSNAGVIAGPDRLMAIDALGPPIHAKRFLATDQMATGKSFDRLVNTHHHRDHTNGNCFFRPAEIVSHDFCRQAVIDQGIPARPYEDRPEWQEGMKELKLAPPTTTFSDRMTYRYGNTVVELLFVGPAHAGMRPGQAAADIDTGRFADWANPDRTVWNTVRLDADFNGTLTPAQDLAAQNRAMEEYNTIRAGRAR